MSELKILNSHLKILQIFGFQFFSLSSLNFNYKSLKFASKVYVVYFIFRIGLLCISLFYLVLFYYNNFQNISIKQNIFGFILKNVATFLSWFRSFNSIVEAFVKIKSNKKFFLHLNNFIKITKKQLEVKIYFKKFHKVLMRRQLYVLISASFLTFSDLTSVENIAGFGFLYQIFIHFVSYSVGFLILYKFCFLVDTICLCLMNFHDNLDMIASTGEDFRDLLKKIYILKRSYIYIIEMTVELKNFMFVTISTSISCSFVWLLTRLYQILLMIFDERQRNDKMTGKAFD